MAPGESDSADKPVEAGTDQATMDSATSPIQDKDTAGSDVQSSSSQPVTSAGQIPTQIRESMIVTAVKFLQNPQVQTSPISQRRAFLKKKGLSDEEIRIALERSGVKEPVSSSAAVMHPPITSVSAIPAAAPPPPPRNLYSTARDYASLAVIISGVTFAIYKFFQTYILPYFRTQGETAKHVQNIEVSIAQLNNTLSVTVEEIQKSVGLIQTSLEKQEEQLDQLSREVAMSKTLAAARGSNGDVLQVKQEITSLKGLLLSRNQFPSTPQQSSIPSWQRKTSTGQQDGHPEEGGANGASSSGEDSPKMEDPGTEEGTLNGKPASDTKVLQLKKSMLENGVQQGGSTTTERGVTGEQDRQRGASLGQGAEGDQNGVNGGREAD